MSYVCTVVFNAEPSVLEAVEAAHPEVIDGIRAAARGLMTSHSRYERAGQTMDVDTYDSAEAYAEFAAKASSLIETFGELVGAPAVDTLWKKR